MRHLLACFLILFSSAVAFAQPGADPSVPPTGFEQICADPGFRVFNVKDFGAKGDGLSDDTVAIRAAIAAAVSNGSGNVYFPAGVYLVCGQPTDVNPGWPIIFRINMGNLVFSGDGPTKSILSGLMPGLKDPKTTWVKTTDSYAKISRFKMFGFGYDGQAAGPIDTIQFRGLSLNGNFPYTGYSLVGADRATGNGWDVTHKAVAFANSVASTRILFFNFNTCNWAGENVYSGESASPSFYFVNSTAWGSNASMISVPAITIESSALGGTDFAHSAYNGTECMCMSPGLGQTFSNSIVQGCGNGNVHIGYRGSFYKAVNSKFDLCYRGILFSESAYNVEVQNNKFTRMTAYQAMITSILGLGAIEQRGFGNWNVTQNEIDWGCLLCNQNYDVTAAHGGEDFPNLSLTKNIVNRGWLLEGGFYGGDYSGFVVDSNVFRGDAVDTGYNYNGHVGIWAGNTYEKMQYAGCKIDFFPGHYTQTAPNTGILYLQFRSDRVQLNAAGTSPQFADINPTLMQFYPVGYKTRIYTTSSPGKWFLVANPAWNNWTAPLQVPSLDAGGVSIQVNSSGVFEVAK
jgi:hypothetical protein